MDKLLLEARQVLSLICKLTHLISQTIWMQKMIHTKPGWMPFCIFFRNFIQRNIIHRHCLRTSNFFRQSDASVCEHLLPTLTSLSHGSHIFSTLAAMRYNHGVFPRHHAHIWHQLGSIQYSGRVLGPRRFPPGRLRRILHNE